MACGRTIHGIKVDSPADILVLDDSSATFAGRDKEQVLDTLIFAGAGNLIRDVMVNGQWVVKERTHINEDEINANYLDSMKSFYT